jgi:hypothetical protein
MTKCLARLAFHRATLTITEMVARVSDIQTSSGVFAVTLPIEGKAIPANGGTIGFAASSPEQVRAWHDAGVAAGNTAIEDPPGVREAAVGRLYVAYLRDLDGNKICALHFMS